MTNSKADRTGMQPRVVSGARKRREDVLRFLYLGSFLLGLALLAVACDPTTTVVFQASFNGDTVGSQPALMQGTGSLLLNPGAGSITVVAAPAPSLPANKWVQISHPPTTSPETVMKGEFIPHVGEGSYGFLASLYMPAGTGIATVDFEVGGRGLTNSPEFLHLDFMPSGNVRIDDDDSHTFGSFPRDHAFVLSVSFVITATSATAHITLFGGASGTADVNITGAKLTFARQFGSVRFWLGAFSPGSFFVDDVLVTRRNS